MYVNNCRRSFTICLNMPGSVVCAPVFFTTHLRDVDFNSIVEIKNVLFEGFSYFFMFHISSSQGAWSCKTQSNAINKPYSRIQKSNIWWWKWYRYWFQWCKLEYQYHAGKFIRIISESTTFHHQKMTLKILNPRYFTFIHLNISIINSFKIMQISSSK